MRGKKWFWLTICLVGLFACAIKSHLVYRPSAFKTTPFAAWRLKVAQAAFWFLETNARAERQDCSGLVVSILNRAGMKVQGNTRSLWTDAKNQGRLVKKPLPGDLVFFDRTYDANRNGLVDDYLTHSAVVMDVEKNGTVVMVHRGSGRTKKLRMNLASPHVHRAANNKGKVLNDFLRAPGYGPSDGAKLSGELFRGFARPPLTSS